MNTNQNILTGLSELDFVIMLELDFESLNNICLTNIAANNICKNDLFWKTKFLNKGFPLPQKPFPITIKAWIDEYNYTLQASNIILINEIELTRKDDPIDPNIGVITMYYLKFKYPTILTIPLPTNIKEKLINNLKKSEDPQNTCNTILLK